MSYDEIQKTIQQWLDTSIGVEERVEKIDDLLHLLNFERRLATLTDEESMAMIDAGKSIVTPEMRKRIDSCTSENERDAVINGYARAQYFKQCAWSAYPNGDVKEKPFTSPRPASVIK